MFWPCFDVSVHTLSFRPLVLGFPNVYTLPFQVTVAGEGGLRALVALSRCEDLELRILAAGALRHLSLNTRVKRPMVEEGALGSILR